ncbi:hypothetical protein M404DRAFT_999275 [Pisolithus tinctorius Marx 270]|uniref:Uncharacterized protein n=1 Tax=Pisolithus tinctorius Marx 270 TaxID=870435 RepID=A0A0C3NYZ3_PISTI|nr:hypothetical protein M404DRAFT_999275 [Pisolithus tinctorius Marx 270]
MVRSLGSSVVGKDQTLPGGTAARHSQGELYTHPVSAEAGLRRRIDTVLMEEIDGHE